MRSELATLQNDVDELVTQAETTAVRADKLYDAAQIARNQRNQKNLKDARLALIDCQNVGGPLLILRSKVTKFDKTHPSADGKVKDQLEQMMADLDYALGQKVLKRIEQLVKDSLQFGQVKKVDPNKAAALIKVTDKKEIQELERLLNTPQGDLEKALTPLAKKHKTSAKMFLDALAQML